MLDVTPAACRAIGTLATRSGHEENSGLRIAVAAKVPGGAEIMLKYSERPEDGDYVVRAAPNVWLFLEPDAVHFMSDKVLDVRQHPDGILRFAVDPKR